MPSKILRYGGRFGSHTHSHLPLNGKYSECLEDLKLSLNLLNKIIGPNGTDISLPLGSYSANLVYKIKLELGINRVFSSDPKMVSSFTIGRFGINKNNVNRKIDNLIKEHESKKRAVLFKIKNAGVKILGRSFYKKVRHLILPKI